MTVILGRRDDLRWGADGEGFALFYRRRRLITVEVESRFLGMWRIRHSDGTLSDMTNFARARDAAAEIVVHDLNTQGSRSGVPPVRDPRKPVVGALSAATHPRGSHASIQPRQVTRTSHDLTSTLDLSRG
jgi:hypothetical protein